MSCEIRKIKACEIKRVCEILSSVVAHMKSVGFTQWGDDYPRRSILEKDIERGELYGVYFEEILAGFVVVNETQDAEYESIYWRYGKPFLVVHRLQVDPKFRGRRLGYELMVFAEKLAKQRGCKSIRLDTRCDNIPAINLYRKLSYEIRGHVHFPRMMEYEFPCMEKEIL